MKTHATNVLRVAATMQSVNSGILSLRPDLEWAEIDNSRSFLPALNPYGSVCPDRSPLDAYILGQENSWYKKYRSYMDEKLDLDAFMSRLFVDPSPVEEAYDKHDLIRRFWLMASLMQGLDRQVPLWDLFTAEEILAWAEIENYRYFAQKGPEPISHGRSWGLGSRTLRHLLEESAEDIARNRHGINLNFGHDGVLMSLLTNLQVGSWAREAHDPADALQSWQYWDIPMGANLQMVFYRSEADAADILVKFVQEEFGNYNLTLVGIDEHLLLEFLKYQTKYGARGIRGRVKKTVGAQLLKERRKDALQNKKVRMTGTIDNIVFESA